MRLVDTAPALSPGSRSSPLTLPKHTPCWPLPHPLTSVHFVGCVRDWTDQPASIAFHLDICPTNPRQGSDALPAYLQVTIQDPFYDGSGHTPTPPAPNCLSGAHDPSARLLTPPLLGCWCGHQEEQAPPVPDFLISEYLNGHKKTRVRQRQVRRLIRAHLRHPGMPPPPPSVLLTRLRLTSSAFHHARPRSSCWPRRSRCTWTRSPSPASTDCYEAAVSSTVTFATGFWQQP